MIRRTTPTLDLPALMREHGFRRMRFPTGEWVWFREFPGRCAIFVENNNNPAELPAASHLTVLIRYIFPGSTTEGITADMTPEALPREIRIGIRAMELISAGAVAEMERPEPL